MTQKPEILSLSVALAALAFVVSPFLSDGFNGFTADQFPVPQTDPPVQPAGYAFSIWGVIYLWLLAGAGFGLLRRASDPDWAAMRLPLALSLAIGAAWIPVAQLSVLWATVMIWAMLATALWALLRCGDGDGWWQRAPVALYAGWLTAASCVSIGLVLAGFDILTPGLAAMAALCLALLIALVMQGLRADVPLYTVAVIWALVGVGVRNIATPNWPVLVLTGAGIALLAWRGATLYARRGRLERADAGHTGDDRQEPAR